jgi:CDP-Glycerol:Poly(glycerophosphate) glycerophosphotransferase
MLLCANEDQKQLYISDAQHRGKRAFITGYPKFDKLIQRGQEVGFWPIKSDRRRFRLIWAPHHSVRQQSLGFGTFHLVYKDMLQWAADDPEIEIVLKPHPMLLETRAGGLLSEAEFNGFLSAWRAFGNTGAQTGGDYAPLMTASDAMLTDGISFLAEYPLFGKPMIWLDSGRHVELNVLGSRSVEAAYRVSTVREAMAIVQRLRSGGPDPLQAKRSEIRDYLMPFPGFSSEKVLEAIRGELRS